MTNRTDGRRRTARESNRAQPIERQDRPIDTEVALDAGPERGLLARILETPKLAEVVPRLQPEVLHRVIQACGLEDCSDLVALATPRQLEQIFDADLWRSARPGLDERLDADRFGVWLDVLMEAGAAVAAQKLVAMDIGLVTAALAQHLRIFDPGAAACPIVEGEAVTEARRAGAGAGVQCEVGGYLVEARRTSAWDTIVALLLFLDEEHPDYFHRVMCECRRLSNAGRELDGLDDLLDDREQALLDRALDRGRRREKLGYVSPAPARAFLQSSRLVSREQAAAPPASPVAGGYFRAIARTPPAAADTDPDSGGPPAPPGPRSAADDPSDAIAAVAEVLAEAGVLTPQPRALLEAPQGSTRLARIEAHLRFARDAAPLAAEARMEEFAYLANTLAAGCSVQARPFTEREASTAVLAICNLGLENWPRQWMPAGGAGAAVAETGTALPDGFLVDRDLVGVFQVGWTVLYQDVCMWAAEQLISVLSDLKCRDRDIQLGLAALRAEMTRHWRAGTPWYARDALDVMAMLDLPAWATMLGLIDECPVVHAGIAASQGSGTRRIDPNQFEFISENSQIAAVRRFVQSLPATLLG
jgi:hypothetical protein